MPESRVGSKAPSITGANPTVYADVMPYLNAGGSALTFYDAREILSAVKRELPTLTELLKGALVEANARDAQTAVSVLFKIYEVSGIESVAAIGSSSVPRSDGLYYHRTFLQFNPSASSEGAIWNLFGTEPGKFDTLQMLPDSTALAYGLRVDLPWLDATLSEVLSAVGQAPAYEEAKAQISTALGVGWSELVASLGDEITFSIFLSGTEVVNLPIPGQRPVAFPAPAAALVVKTKNNILFESIARMAQETTGAPQVEDGCSLLTKQIPNPVGLDFSPTLASFGNSLVFSTSKSIPISMKQIQGGEARGLLNSPEFEKLSRDMTLEGNVYTYISRQYRESVGRLVQLTLEQSGAGRAVIMPSLAKLYLQLLIPSESFTVAARSGPNWLVSGNGPNGFPNQYQTQVFMPSMLAAVAVPGFLRARERSQATTVLNDARLLDAAVDQLAIETNLRNGTPVAFDSIKPYLRAGRLTQSGGCDIFGRPYTILPVGSGVKVHPATMEQ